MDFDALDSDAPDVRQPPHRVFDPSPKLVRGLLSQRREGRWRTTQATAWALGALDDARRYLAPSTHGNATVFLDEQAAELLDDKVLDAAVLEDRIAFSIRDQSGPPTFSPNGAGPA